MSADILRTAQAPLRARYRDTPEAARITLRARGRIVDDFGCRIDTGRTPVVAGMHPGVGGSGRGACPGDMLLEALAACAGVTLNAAATGLGIPLRSASVRVEGDLDFRGALGMSTDVPIGFESIRIEFELDTDASEEQLATLLQRTEMFCVVYQTLARPPAFAITRTRAGG